MTLNEAEIIRELGQHDLPVEQLVTQLDHIALLTIPLGRHFVDARLRTSEQRARLLELPLRQQTPTHGQQEPRMPELQSGWNTVGHRQDRRLVARLHELFTV